MLATVGAVYDRPFFFESTRIKAKPGLEDTVRQELFKLLGPTRSEKGCINYDMRQSCDDPSLFLFHENWSSDEDLGVHLAAPHIKSWFEKSKTLLAEPVEVTRWKRVG